jgi:predicted HNH restriction endonuclease
MTDKSQFLHYLTNTKRSNGKNYESSTIKTYVDSIALITADLNNHLISQIDSLYNIQDVKELKHLFDKLYSIPQIQKEEVIQRKRKTNAFRRYIEFRETIQELGLTQNQPDLQEVEQSRTEGGKKVVISLRSERDGRLRSQALMLHGTTCFGCEFNFKKVYGDLGEGFIEIHHLQLLSGNLAQVITDPRTDLIPLCSNCHRMVHRKKGYVLSLAELKAVINLQSSDKLPDVESKELV